MNRLIKTLTKNTTLGTPVGDLAYNDEFYNDQITRLVDAGLELEEAVDWMNKQPRKYEIVTRRVNEKCVELATLRRDAARKSRLEEQRGVDAILNWIKQ